MSCKCILDSQKLPITSDYDHQIGNCYCYLCECGRHKCPAEYPRRNYVTTKSYKTQYKREHSKKKSQTAISPVRYDLINYSVQHPGDFKTIMKTDFQLQKSFDTPTKVQNDSSRQPYQYRFKYQTTNQSNYPNWGPCKVDILKHPQDKHYTKELKMYLNSTYKDQYQQRPSTSNNDIHKRSKSSKAPYSQCMPFCQQTTNNTAFKRPNTKQVSLSYKTPSPRHDYLQYSNFKSTYRANYSPPPQKKVYIPTKRKFFISSV